MPSSGITLSLPDRPAVRLLLLVTQEDHPRACTGRKLIRRHLVEPVRTPRSLGPRPIVLDPMASEPLSIADRLAARRGGLMAVDCSWNRLARRSRFPGALGRHGYRDIRRRLPLLLAANPQHYGHIGELNTAEAFAASLHVLGEVERAETLLKGLRGGDAFFDINRRYLNGYRNSASADGIRACERSFF